MGSRGKLRRSSIKYPGGQHGLGKKYSHLQIRSNLAAKSEFLMPYISFNGDHLRVTLIAERVKIH